MLLLLGSLLCGGLLPQAQGKAQHLVFIRISKNQLETDISDMFLKHHVLDRLAKIPVMGATSEGATILDHLPFVRKGLSKKSSGLDLSLVTDLLLGQSLPPLGKLLQAGGLVIEDAKGPEVTLQILSDSLLQVTLRNKLYLSLQRILRFKVIKNIRIGVRLEQIGNKTNVAFEECHTPPGFLNIEVLEHMGLLLVNEALKLATDVLDKALPFLLQKIVCPLATTLLNLLLEDLLHITLPPTISDPEDFQYHVTTTEFTEEAILMKVQLVTPCGSGKRAPKPDYLDPNPLPTLAQDSMADLAFPLETYNDILSCLYSSKEVHVNLWDPTAADLIQLLLPRELELGPKKLLSKAVFSSKNRELKLQFTPNSIAVTLGPYPPGLAKQEERLEASVLELLRRRFLPHHNNLLREQGLLLPNIKGISFDQAQMEPSQNHLLLTVPKE